MSLVGPVSFINEKDPLNVGIIFIPRLRNCRFELLNVDYYKLPHLIGRSGIRKNSLQLGRKILLAVAGRNSKVTRCEFAIVLS